MYETRLPFVDFHERDKRWAIIVAHRRAGKTVACVMDLLTAAISTVKKDARYFYVAPFREQAKTVAWTYLKQYAMPLVHDPESDFRESDLTVRLANGAHVRLFGSDNPNALRGIYADGVVLDEYADMRPGLWGEVIRPALADRNGWAVFIGTPRGHNAFYDLWQSAQNDPEWYTLMLKSSTSGILPASEIEAIRRQLTPAQFDQEMECSFDAAILGAIYAKELDKHQGQISRVPYDGSQLVHVAWDIGVGDSTALWLWQHVGHEIHIIDCYESNGERIPHYLAWLKSRPYQYATMWLPHDAENRQLTGLSVAEVIREAGFGIQVLPRLALEDGINAARMLFTRLWFDRERCSPGLEALRNYRWAYNDRMGEMKSTPVHDWSSHFADALRYLAQACKSSGAGTGGLKLPPLNYPKRRVV